jgi:hypothetical protein
MLDKILNWTPNWITNVLADKPDKPIPYADDVTVTDEGPSSLDKFSPWMWTLKIWMGWGVKEGVKNWDDLIVSFFNNTTYKTKTSKTPWCAAGMNTVLVLNSYKGTNSAAAKSFGKLGVPCELKYGAMVHIQHPGNHITSCYDPCEGKDYFLGLGCNQNNSVCISKYPKSTIKNIRWPTERLVGVGVLG